MYGIQYKTLNNAKNEWEWRWVMDNQKPMEFVTPSEAWNLRDNKFPGHTLAQSRVMPLKGVAA